MPSPTVSGSQATDYLKSNTVITNIQLDVNDSVIGGTGTNQFTVGNGGAFNGPNLTTSVIVTGNSNGPVVINTGSGSDTVFGGLGNDLINGGSGANTLFGGSGLDRIDLTGGGGSRVIGNMGSDTILSSGSSNLITGYDTLRGGMGNDSVIGSGSHDSIYGDRGNDIINGGAGDDVIRGSNLAGTDLGNDTLGGGAGNDTILAGNGNDYVIGESGNDQLTGGEGKDIFIFSPGDGNDTIADFKHGVDTLAFTSINFGGTPLGITDILARASNVDGNAVITLPNGQSITLIGINAADLSINDFIMH